MVYTALALTSIIVPTLETGGIAIPFQYEPEGSCPESVAHMKPFFGVEPVLLTEKVSSHFQGCRWCF